MWSARRLCLALSVGLLLAVFGCDGEDPASTNAADPGVSRPLIVVGTSMVQCAVRDLAGDAVRIHTLGPPGQCPGHFDLKPADFHAIAAADVLLRHDYQSQYDEKLGAIGGVPRIVELPTTGPQTMPGNYVKLCELVAERLAEVQPALAETVGSRLAEVSAAEGELAASVHGRAAALAGKPVIASSLQKEFCQWLGLRVVGEFDRADDMSLKQLAALVQAGRAHNVAAVVANLQRGEHEGRPIAERLGVPLVLLSNFPLHPEEPGGHALLVRRNVEKLLEVCVE